MQHTDRAGKTETQRMERRERGRNGRNMGKRGKRAEERRTLLMFRERRQRKSQNIVSAPSTLCLRTGIFKPFYTPTAKI